MVPFGAPALLREIDLDPSDPVRGRAAVLHVPGGSIVHVHAPALADERVGRVSFTQPAIAAALKLADVVVAPAREDVRAHDVFESNGMQRSTREVDAHVAKTRGRVRIIVVA